MKNVKIAIPTDGQNGLDEKVADHFGRSETYTFLDGKGAVIKIIKNISEHMGGAGLPPELMEKHGVDILLCKDLGPRALNLCRELGIEVYCGEARTTGEFFEKWRDGKLQKATSQNVCEEHKLFTPLNK